VKAADGAKAEAEEAIKAISETIAIFIVVQWVLWYINCSWIMCWTEGCGSTCMGQTWRLKSLGWSVCVSVKIGYCTVCTCLPGGGRMDGRAEEEGGEATRYLVLVVPGTRYR
jgi:hypothetical protein